MRTIKLIYRLITLLRMYIDSSKSNDFQQKKSKEGMARAQIKDKDKSGKTVETHRRSSTLIK